MPLYADRVQETSTTSGTGTVTLAGVVTGGYQTFASALTDQDRVYYCIVDSTNSTWEVGDGVWSSGGGTLTRENVYSSSNAGALVNFAAGTTKNVFIVEPAVMVSDWSMSLASQACFVPV